MKSLVLPPLSTLFSVITRTRNALYERGTFRSTRLERPVISVGNITTGGTGKTPLVEFVARTITDQGKRVCILTRGYGRKDPKQRVIVSDGSSVFSNPSEAGDEPYLLARNLPGVAVISDANRTSAGEGAIKHLRSECFVLDDGFQHRQLTRDLDIVTIDATNPWGGGELLPYGRLREPLESLKRADCLVVTRCDQADDLSDTLTKLVKLSGDRPIFQSRMNAKRLTTINESTSALPKRVLAYCAIGNPESFFNSVRQQGIDVVSQRSFRDHHVYTQSEIDKLVSDAHDSGAEALVTTAKDSVKLTDLTVNLPCYSLEIEIEIENAEQFRQMIASVLK
jgi:tetraacyldisaccharide 4'-kinase